MILITWWRMSFEWRLSVLLLWPILLLVSFIPGAPLGPSEVYGYEGTPLHLVAAIITLPFTFAYWGFMLLQLGRWIRGRQENQDLGFERRTGP